MITVTTSARALVLLYLLMLLFAHLEDVAATQVVAELTGELMTEFASKFWVEIQASKETSQAQAL